ncbi:MAG: hypothetical protein HY077_13365 [Elusimicrobia bacterium]|nr:hypothetical protein [Elusimicrobiota bacterium]
MAARDPLAGRQILILSSVEWDSAWQRHQIFAAQWAAAGHEVFFVENTGFRWPGLRDAARVGRKLAGLTRGAPKAAAPVPPGLRVVNPAVLPPRGKAPRRLNEAVLLPRLAAKLAALGLRPGALAVAYLPTATTLSLLDLLKPETIVYDCVDNFSGHACPPSDLARTEGELMRRSALVITTSSTLRQDKAALHPNVLQFHHGVAADFFLASSPRAAYRRFCYFGTLRGELDYAPVAALAEAGFEVELIGPVKQAPPPLPRGVALRGGVAPAELARTLASFDALLLPYRDDAYNRGIFPAKIYECLATGRPVLSSPLPALAELSEHLTFCRTPGEWVKAAEALPQTETPAKRAARVELARGFTHSRAFARLREAVTDALRAPHGR